jgi:hypothetical protein
VTPAEPSNGCRAAPAEPGSGAGELVEDCAELVDGPVEVGRAHDEWRAVAERCEQVIAFLHGIQVRALARFAMLRPHGSPSRPFDEFAADAVAHALGWTRNGAAGRLSHAVDLTTRHPEALAALYRPDG